MVGIFLTKSGRPVAWHHPECRSQINWRIDPRDTMTQSNPREQAVKLTTIVLYLTSPGRCGAYFAPQQPGASAKFLSKAKRQRGNEAFRLNRIAILKLVGAAAVSKNFDAVSLYKASMLMRIVTTPYFLSNADCPFFLPFSLLWTSCLPKSASNASTSLRSTQISTSHPQILPCFMLSTLPSPPRLYLLKPTSNFFHVTVTMSPL